HLKPAPLLTFDGALDFIKQRTAMFFRNISADFCKLTEQLLLFFVQFRWRFHLDDNVLVARAVAVNVLDAFAFQTETRSALGSCRDFQFHFARYSRHFNFVAKCCLCNGNGQIHVNIIAVALERFMRSDAEDYIQISSWPTVYTWAALSRNTQLLAIIDACRDGNFDFLDFADFSFTVACCTFFWNDLSSALAMLASTAIDHTAKRCVLRDIHLARPFTIRASFRFCPRLCT